MKVWCFLLRSRIEPEPVICLSLKRCIMILKTAFGHIYGLDGADIILTLFYILWPGVCHGEACSIQYLERVSA